MVWKGMGDLYHNNFMLWETSKRNLCQNSTDSIRRENIRHYLQGSKSELRAHWYGPSPRPLNTKVDWEFDKQQKCPSCQAKHKGFKDFRRPFFYILDALNIVHYNNVFTSRRLLHTTLLRSYSDQVPSIYWKKKTVTKACRTYSFYYLHQIGYSKATDTFASFCLWKKRQWFKNNLGSLILQNRVI